MLPVYVKSSCLPLAINLSFFPAQLQERVTQGTFPSPFVKVPGSQESEILNFFIFKSCIIFYLWSSLTYPRSKCSGCVFTYIFFKLNELKLILINFALKMFRFGCFLFVCFFGDTQRCWRPGLYRSIPRHNRAHYKWSPT